MSCNLLLSDVDGVLCENKFSITSDGKISSKTFHCWDSRAIYELVSAGWEIHFLTASKWPGSEKYMEKLKVFLHVKRDKSDLHSITLGRPFYAIGDDAWDVSMLEQADKAFCPNDAFTTVKKINNINVMKTNGGQGIFAELALELLGENKWN